MTISEWQKAAHELAVHKGWWVETRLIPELLCLLHSEISEGLEAYRNNDMAMLGEEMADLAIRLFDMCGGIGINLEAEIEKKHAYNKTRLPRHGNKLC